MKQRAPLRRYAELKRSANLCRSIRIPRINRDAKARRDKKYQAHLKSAYFRALRLECFARDNYTCQCRCGVGPLPVAELRCDHIRYTRFGHERLSDLRTMRVQCHDAKDGWKWKRVP
jgi:5-methylcytosine-specific restriction endonuclease McrA